MDSIVKFFSNPKVQKFLLYLAIVIVILIILSSVSDGARKFFRKLRGREGDDAYAPIDKDRKIYLQKLASDINTGVNQIVGNDLDTYLEISMNLSDSEFAYLVEYYNKHFSNTMYHDIDWEFMWWTDVDDDVLARIQRQNLPT